MHMNAVICRQWDKIASEDSLAKNIPMAMGYF